MTTAFIGVEALSNSHPLTYQSAHPKDTSPLMPNHLLHGQIGESAPEIDEEIAYILKNLWRLISLLEKMDKGMASIAKPLQKMDQSMTRSEWQRHGLSYLTL